MPMTTALRRIAFMLLAFSIVGPATSAAQPDEFTATMAVTGADRSETEIAVAVAPGQTRMGVSTPAAQLSLVFRENGSMLMARHAERQYLELTGQQLAAMQQMMGRASRNRPEPDEFDLSQVRFTETGRREMVGTWNAFEVRVDDGEVHFWISDDPPVGLIEVGQRLATATAAMAGPMAQGMEGGREFLRFRALANAQGLPNGRVVRIVATDDDGPSVITLTEANASAVPPGAFDAPNGYTPMQMPGFPGRPELRIIMPIVGIISTVALAPWDIVWAWLAPIPDTVQEQVDDAIGHGFDGIIVYVDQTGKAPGFYTAGWKNRENQIPADPNALFKIASAYPLDSG